MSCACNSNDKGFVSKSDLDRELDKFYLPASAKNIFSKDNSFYLYCLGGFIVAVIIYYKFLSPKTTITTTTS